MIDIDADAFTTGLEEDSEATAENVFVTLAGRDVWRGEEGSVVESETTVHL